MKIELLPLSKIVADKDQPRKDFDVSKLATLRKSIKEHGILTPLTVQEQADGTYLLIDGERRFRTAKDLKLKEVPALVRGAMNETQRLIEQFHIQETHAGWTGTEKAEAIRKLSDTLKITMREMGDMLGVPNRTMNEYLAYAQLADRSSFDKSGLPMRYVQPARAVINRIKKVATLENRKISRGDEKDLENMIFSRVLQGELKNASEVNQMSDIIVAGGMKMYDALLDKKNETVDLQVISKSKSVTAMRRLLANANYIINIFNILENGSVKEPSQQLLTQLKMLKTKITSYLNLFAD